MSRYKYQQLPLSASSTTPWDYTINTAVRFFFFSFLTVRDRFRSPAAPPGEDPGRGNMAPSARPSDTGLCLEEDESHYGIQKADRKVMEGWGPSLWTRRHALVAAPLRSWKLFVVGGDGEMNQRALSVYKVCVLCVCVCHSRSGSLWWRRRGELASMRVCRSCAPCWRTRR